MPMNREYYPKDWNAIALAIKEKANWFCDECGRPCRKSKESLEDFSDRLIADYDPHESYWIPQLYEEVFDEETGEFITVSRSQRFTLTVAHLNHMPTDCDRANLRALCAPCHCRYDLKAMPLKKTLKREREGQLRLEVECS
jgi:hypothetical protein